MIFVPKLEIPRKIKYIVYEKKFLTKYKGEEK